MCRMESRDCVINREEERSMTNNSRGGAAVVCLLVWIVCLGITNVSYADNAEVLPKGVRNLSVEGLFYFPIEKQFDDDGNVEEVATDYNGVLDSNIFADLGLVEAGFGMPPGSANVGTSDVSFKYNFTILKLTFMYGITDRFTAGIKIPYWWAKNTVDRRLDASQATVGKNPFYGLPADPFGGSPFVPIAFGGVKLTTDDVLDLLGKGLDVNNDGTIDIPGYKYKKFATWSNNGIGDIEIGGRYQYLKTDNWRLAFTGGVRFPTGEIDDPDNLVDYGIGNGAYALLFHLNNDYTGIKNTVLNATLRYHLVLPAKETLRIPDDVDRPITANKENVDRDIGDVFELEVSGKYVFAKGFSAELLYLFGYGFKDRINGNRGYSYESLEDESNYSEHVFIGGLSYSTLPLFQEKKFPLPMTFSLSYRNRFAGENALKSQYISAGLQIYF